MEEMSKLYAKKDFFKQNIFDNSVHHLFLSFPPFFSSTSPREL